MRTQVESAVASARLGLLLLTVLYCPLDKIPASDFDIAGFSATQSILIRAYRDVVRVGDQSVV